MKYLVTYADGASITADTEHMGQNGDGWRIDQYVEDHGPVQSIVPVDGYLLVVASGPMDDIPLRLFSASELDAAIEYAESVRLDQVNVIVSRIYRRFDTVSELRVTMIVKLDAAGHPTETTVYARD